MALITSDCAPKPGLCSSFLFQSSLRQSGEMIRAIVLADSLHLLHGL